MAYYLVLIDLRLIAGIDRLTQDRITSPKYSDSSQKL